MKISLVFYLALGVALLSGASCNRERVSDAPNLTNCKVLSYEPANERGVGGDECSKWQPPTKDEFTTVLGQLKATNMDADYEAHADYPCEVRGLLNVGADTFEFRLNAGGYITLFQRGKPEEHRYCARKNKALLKYFLSIEHDVAKP